MKNVVQNIVKNVVAQNSRVFFFGCIWLTYAFKIYVSIQLREKARPEGREFEKNGSTQPTANSQTLATPPTLSASQPTLARHQHELQLAGRKEASCAAS
jgi:hypothetical protein